MCSRNDTEHLQPDNNEPDERTEEQSVYNREITGWVARALEKTLPVYSTHNGCDAYIARQSDANPFDVYPDY